MTLKWLLLPIVIAALAGTPALAQLTIILPAKGQSPAQQKKDEQECDARAVKQSGHDPAKSSSQNSAPGPGGMVANSEAAKAGPVVGGVSGRAESRQQQLQHQDQLQARAQGKGPEGYNKAKMACLVQRGYKVN